MPTREQQRQRELLNAVNSVATVLLASEKTEDFKSSLQKGMELMGLCVDVDFIEIWQNVDIGGDKEAHLLHKWQGALISDRPVSIDVFAYNDTPHWYDRFILGEIINGPVSHLSKEDQKFLEPFNIKSTVIIPLFIQDELWGISCIDDCRIERNFSSDELDILRSASLMMVNAINRNIHSNEHLKMMNELVLRDNLLYLVNSVSAMMFTAVTKEDFNISLSGSLDLMGRCVDADRLQIWQNLDVEGELHFILKYQWLSDLGQTKRSPPINHIFPYRDFPGWEDKFSKCEYINSTYANLNLEEQSLLESFDLKYLLIFPLFVHEQFWGFFSLDDCHGERGFEGEELDILRSGSLIMVNAINRNLMMEELEKQDALLKSALNQAQDANNAKSSFLARMSHEMRTPLNAVIGLSELSLLEADELTEEVQLNLEKIHSAGTTLLSTVNDILDISKIEAGKFELDLTEYDTPSLINDAVTQSIMRIDEKPIKFVLEIEETLPSRLYGDDLRIKQILNNLLSNAFKYTKKGTVELGITYATKENEKLGFLTIYVKDSGVGIKQEDLDDLFSDYAMMDTKTNRKIEGTGLGLPITKHIAEMMGGNIFVESEYGIGSKFTVILPQKALDAPVIGREVVNSLKNLRYIDQKRRLRFSINKIKLNNAKVLVVDDVATNLDVARGMLKTYGISADCLTSGYDAVEAVKAEKVKYNAIFMDHMMPGMDGMETVRIIREEIDSEYAKTVPIIALTANAIVGNEEMFLKNGFQAFIAKPIELLHLDEVIQKFLGEFAEESISPLGKQGLTNYTIEGLDIINGIKRFRGNEKAYLEVLKTYAESTVELLDSIRSVDPLKLNDYEIIVHGIKGSSYSIGAAPVASLAEKLENEADNGNFDYIDTHNDDFIKEAEKIIFNIKSMLENLREIDVKPLLKSPSIELLKKLSASCENYDMDGIDTAIAEITKYDYEENSELSFWLKENAEKANFGDIVNRLKELGI